MTGRKVLVLATVLFLAVLADLGSLSVFMPAALAYACPACFGFERAGAGIQVEHSMSGARREALATAFAEARSRVEQWYPDLRSRPVWLVCDTEACDRRLGGKGAKAVAYGDHFIRVSPRGMNATILAHEWAHTEFHGRIGTEALTRGIVPAWFDEGLAVVVSRDSRYLETGLDGTLSCREQPTGGLPETAREWGKEAGQGERPIYAMAGCRVLTWLNEKSGRRSLAMLSERTMDSKDLAQWVLDSRLRDKPSD